MVTYNDLDDNLKAMIREVPAAIINHADGEDLTVRQQVLKFADRHKATTAYSNRGMIIVRRKEKTVIRENLEIKINILNQDMMTEDSTIYVIRYEHDLNGQTIEVPSNCILVFDGGKLINGTVNLNGAQLVGVSLYPEEFIQNIGTGLRAGTPHWTTDGYIEWWDGSKWFNPYTTLNDALNRNLSNINQQLVGLNDNLVQSINAINQAALNETNARTAADDDLDARIDNEVTDRIEGDTKLQSLIDKLNVTHTNDIVKVKQLIQANTDLINQKENEIVAAYRADDDALRKKIIEGLETERRSRINDIATAKQEIVEMVKENDDIHRHLLRGVYNELNKVTSRTDKQYDEVHIHLNKLNELIQQNIISIIDLQNRLDKVNERIDELEDNANKYLVRFKLPDGTIVGGQYVVPGGTPIVPDDIAEGVVFDKDFSIVNEDMLINVTI